MWPYTGFAILSRGEDGENMGPIDWPIIGKQVGMGLLLGFALGYAAKKAIKVAFVAIGILLLALVSLQNLGFISIHWTEIEAAYNQTIQPSGGFDTTLQGWLDSLAALLPGVGGFSAGFVWGLKKG